MEDTQELEPVSAFVWAGLILAVLSALFIFLSFVDAKGIFGPMGSVGMLVAAAIH
ncbi:hypothetical protein G7068_09570 [Leucobacter viscericola]|uniref:Uncharacterized protein n=1 Tax=Leucobacter viscericola TaxID=2714935 RepID=A0A6G7XG51_9MICO|nr:hypothetical protein [Leucobacter viscericola]QIK63419.1 hypothetical protein G7068_09570 [Leucobacter viscericola]